MDQGRDAPLSTARSVLVIEDQATVAFDLQRFLEGTGYRHGLSAESANGSPGGKINKNPTMIIQVRIPIPLRSSRESIPHPPSESTSGLQIPSDALPKEWSGNPHTPELTIAPSPLTRTIRFPTAAARLKARR